MRHFALPRFWKCYRELPSNVQKLANKNYGLLRSDPAHPSLHFKKIGTNKQLWSVRIGIGYRALGVEKPDGIYWFWIGSHTEYDRLIN
jgi:hypothetical protein